MKQSRSARTAELKQVLVYYDGPQLALLQSSRHYPMLAVGVQRSDMQYGMFACEIIGNALERYRYGRADLNFVFRSTPPSRLFFVDFGELVNGEARLIKATQQDIANRDYYPLPGIFSRSHTEDWEDAQSYAESLKEFNIDGTWEARDFSRFYAKLADIYSLTSIASDLSDKSATKEEIYDLRQSIDDRPWRGGGSYLSFYGSAKGHVTSSRPLRVDSIAYHSPGHISVAGDASDLKNVDKTVQNFISKRAELTIVYRAVHKVLRTNGYLKADRHEIFIVKELSDYIFLQTKKLAEIIGLPNPVEVFSACEQNPIIFAKVVLSFSRRVGDLAAFYIEGRIASEGVSFDAIGLRS